MLLTSADFGELTAKIKQVSQKYASGRLLSVLEGGYDLDALGSSVSAHVKALME
jgi:acetoin utilization deacetylase AcuC-like enzyme